MAYQEEEKTRQRRLASKQAIDLAMEGRWQEAVAVNKGILENFPNDVDACNRLARAYMELGEYALARETYEKAVSLDPYNTIARKNLNRLSHLGETAASTAVGNHRVEPQQFIEEVGKAGVVNLRYLAPAAVLAKTVAGSKVNLKIVGNGLVAENNNSEYLGQVEPKHGQRLIKLMQGGNKYSGAVVSSTEEGVAIMIRETFQDPSQTGKLSFPPKGTEGFRPYVGDRIIRRELEYEEALPGESSYQVIGGDDSELLSEEPLDIDDESENEE